MAQYKIEFVKEILHSRLLTIEEHTIHNICTVASKRNINIASGNSIQSLSYPYDEYSTYYSVSNKL